MRRQDKEALRRHTEEESRKAGERYRAYLLSGRFRSYSEEDETVPEYREARAAYDVERLLLLQEEAADAVQAV